MVYSKTCNFFPPTPNHSNYTSTHYHLPPHTHKKYPTTPTHPKHIFTHPYLHPPIKNIQTPSPTQNIPPLYTLKVYLHPPNIPPSTPPNHKKCLSTHTYPKCTSTHPHLPQLSHRNVQTSPPNHDISLPTSTHRKYISTHPH